MAEEPEIGMSKALYDKLVAHVNRKQWWHVPPVDPAAYKKRGKFYSVSFKEAEFWAARWTSRNGSRLQNRWSVTRRESHVSSAFRHRTRV